MLCFYTHVQQQDEDEDEDDDYDAEEWERYEALHDDVDKQVKKLKILNLFMYTACGYLGKDNRETI